MVVMVKVFFLFVLLSSELYRVFLVYYIFGYLTSWFEILESQYQYTSMS
jgi:hypothetical protein